MDLVRNKDVYSTLCEPFFIEVFLTDKYLDWLIEFIVLLFSQDGIKSGVCYGRIMDCAWSSGGSSSNG